MPSYIVKLGEDQYLSWSTVTDSPTTYICTRKQLEKILRDDCIKEFEEEVKGRFKRADAKGVSCHFKLSFDDLLSNNRAGKDGKKLTKEQILEEFIWKGEGEKEEAPPAICDGCQKMVDETTTATCMAAHQQEKFLNGCKDDLWYCPSCLDKDGYCSDCAKKKKEADLWVGGK